MKSETTVKAEVIGSYQEESRRGYLVCLSIAQGRTHVMYLESGEEWETAELCSDPVMAHECFCRAWDGGLSPNHLKNFCEDEKKRLEIFQ